MDNDYYRLWADAIQPLRISEVSDTLLDQPLAIDDSQLDSTLFSAPLPVYETPWLSRAPAQTWEAREGCESYVANRALDLLDMDAQRALRAWFRGAKADAECLEALGPQCDRRSRPATIAIGQDLFHRGSRGYIWDCREQPCRLLDFERETSTHWDMEYLRDKLDGYPDQKLASNILEGIRLEADLELMAVLNPQLASIGDGYVSVQKTVRELKDSDSYEFFDALPFMPIVVVGQGSRIEAAGATSADHTNWSPISKGYARYPSTRRPRRTRCQSGYARQGRKRSAMGQGQVRPRANPECARTRLVTEAQNFRRRRSRALQTSCVTSPSCYEPRYT